MESQTPPNTNPGALEETIGSAEDLHAYLRLIQTKMEDESTPPVFCLASLNWALNTPKIYEYLNEANRELARELWLRIKQSGVRIRAPRLLFSAEEMDGNSGVDEEEG